MDDHNCAPANEVTPASRPVLKKFVRLHEDKSRDRTVLLAPEQVLTPNPIALEILKLCDGERSVECIARNLSERYEADPQDIISDIVMVLQDLVDKGLMTS